MARYEVKRIPPAGGLSFALCLFATVGAHAQEDAGPPRGSPDDPAVQRALQLSADAEHAFAEGDPEGAIRLLREARSHFPAPVLLYNIGRAQEELGRTAEAIASYEQYLREEPAAPDRVVLERRLASLRAGPPPDLVAGASDPVGDPAEPPAPDPASPSLVGPVVIGALGVGALVAGLLVGIAAKDAEGAADDAPTGRDAMDAFERAEERALAANVLLAAGAALSATSAVWLVVALPGGSDDEHAGLSGRLSMRVRF